jgi:hypothetical protein
MATADRNYPYQRPWVGTKAQADLVDDLKDLVPGASKTAVVRMALNLMLGLTTDGGPGQDGLIPRGDTYRDALMRGLKAMGAQPDPQHLEHRLTESGQGTPE